MSSMGRNIFGVGAGRKRVGVRTAIDTGGMRPREKDKLDSRGAIVN